MENDDKREQRILNLERIAATADKEQVRKLATHLMQEEIDQRTATQKLKLNIET